MSKKGVVKGAGDRYIFALLANTSMSVFVIVILVSFYFSDISIWTTKTYVSECMDAVSKIKSNLSISYFAKGKWPDANIFDIEPENFQVIKKISFDGVGTINVEFNNKVSSLKDKTLSFTVAMIPEVDNSNILWVCGYADAPKYFKLIGKNQTTINSQFLPSACKKNHFKTEITKVIK